MSVLSIADGLRHELGSELVLRDVPRHYLVDATEARGVRGSADAVALPRTTQEVADVMRWCCVHDVPVVPRGGGTGFSGGCVPQGGVVISLERMNRIRAVEPLLWRMSTEAGVTTASVRDAARSNGLVFPPDPGAAEQSQIGGNVATNAGGPHAFKYGVTANWVTGMEVVVPPGEIVTFGGEVRKDVAGYDFVRLLAGSEGTLGVITSVSLRLMPAPEAAWPVVALYPDIAAGCAAVDRVLGYGLQPAALEFLDPEAFALARSGFPVEGTLGAAFVVIAEADGTESAAAALQTELRECLAEDASTVYAPRTAASVEQLWRWRDGVSLAVQAARGGKVSEDVAVPLERLAEMMVAVDAIGHEHGLKACSWGHAGDGNIHATFLVAPENSQEVAAGERAAGQLFRTAVALGGTISGEHGLGLVKEPYLPLQLTPRAHELHWAVKRVFDPSGILNPGKKIA